MHRTRGRDFGSVLLLVCVVLAAAGIVLAGAPVVRLSDPAAIGLVGLVVAGVTQWLKRMQMPQPARQNASEVPEQSGAPSL